MIALCLLNELVEITEGAGYQVGGEIAFGLAFTEGTCNSPTVTAGVHTSINARIGSVRCGRTNTEVFSTQAADFPSTFFELPAIQKLLHGSSRDRKEGTGLLTSPFFRTF